VTAGREALLPARTRPVEKPKLVFVYSSRSGASRRVDGYLAQTLQHRHNHDTFQLLRIDVEKQAELAKRFGITKTPALLVISGRRIQAQLADPKGQAPIAKFLSPWLK
jgi:thioredoxin-like negative regulator of GroEL